jgi:hypothetical protein
MGIEKRKNSTSVSAREAIADVLNTFDEQELDPIEELCKIAKDAGTPLDDKISVLKELAQYKAPKRKSVDVNLESSEGITVKIIKINNPEQAAEKMFNKSEGADGDNTTT